MGDVTRDEFDRLVDRVARIERTQGAMVEITAAEIVGLRTYLDERFGLVDHRLDGIDHRLGLVDHRLDGIDHRLGLVDHRLDGIDLRLGVSEEAIGGLTQLVETVHAIGVQQNRKVDALMLHFHVDPDTPAE
jgi:hypothetical protein